MTNSVRQQWLRTVLELPLIAILRGVEPKEAVAVATALHEAGFLCVEVPLNSPQPLISIRAIAQHFAGKMLVGAGTVLSKDEVNAVYAAGGQLIVSPNTNTDVIQLTKQLGMISLPGIFTATEAFSAAAAGADAVKLFPAEGASPAMLKALCAVLPQSRAVFPVGGITVDNMAAYKSSGAAGFGIGSSLYQPGMTAEQVQQRARQFVIAWRACTA